MDTDPLSRPGAPVGRLWLRQNPAGYNGTIKLVLRMGCSTQTDVDSLGRSTDCVGLVIRERLAGLGGLRDGSALC